MKFSVDELDGAIDSIYHNAVQFINFQKDKTMRQLAVDDFLKRAPILTVRKACDELKDQKALALAFAIEKKIGENSFARIVPSSDSKVFNFKLTLPPEHSFLTPGLCHLGSDLHVTVNLKQKSAVVTSIYFGRHCSELLSRLNNLLGELLEELDGDSFFDARSFFDTVNFIIDLEDGRFILVDSRKAILIQ